MAILKDLIVQGPSRFIGETKGTKFVTDGGTSSLFVKGDGSLDSTEYVSVTKGTKTYTGVIGTADNNPGAVFYFLSVKPKDWNAPCVIKYRITASMAGQIQGTAQSVMSLCFCRNTVPSYDVWNYIGNTSYRPYYYHYRYLLTLAGYNAGYGHLVGIGLQSSYGPTNSTYARTFVIDVLETENCDFEFLSSMTKYASVPGTGSTNFSGESTFDATTQGETHTSDRNTTNLISLTGGLGPAGSLGIFPYTLIMQEGNGSWSPIVTSYSTGTTKAVNTAGFRTDFIFHYYNSSAAAANAVNITGLYLVNTLDFRYSANCGTTLTNSRPIYLVGTFNPDDGLFYLDSTTWWSQEVDPNGNPTRYIDSNGEVKYVHKAYILLGQTYSTYQIQLYPDHPIYYGYNGEVKLWSKESEKEERIYRYLRLESDYLTFEALSDGTMRFSGLTNCNISYSLDNGETWSEAANYVSFDVSNGDKVMWKGEMTPTTYGIGRFGNVGTTEAKYAVYGNLNSLLYGDNFVGLHVVANAFRSNSSSYGLFDGSHVIDASGLVLDDTLANYCYLRMFARCTSLTNPPQLPATTLALNCYLGMFNGCTSLTTPPKLPATTLASYCYLLMFYGCTSLITVPELPATTLASYCYSKMFLGCTNLIELPEYLLPATTLASYCYEYMFLSCTSLTRAPVELPATTLASYCYEYMFGACTSLTIAPELPATTLDSYCYLGMFLGCTSLEYTEIGPWYSFDYFEIPEGEESPEFEGFTLAPGCFRNMFCNCHSLDGIGINLDYNHDMVGYCFDSMFEGCNLSYPPSLTINTTADYCCRRMFKDNINLTFHPTYQPVNIILNATTLSSNCYLGMFLNTGLSDIALPSLPATTLASYCYSLMFLECIGLENPNIQLPATTLASYCYYDMFYGCTSLITAPELPATTLANSCYGLMFYGCTSLTTPPQLPVTTLANSCYYDMFNGCTSLTNPPQLPATTLVNSCYDSMFNGCTSLTIAPELPATTLASYCYSYMFAGCTSLKEIPDLLATTHANSCYYRMFLGCTSLEKATNIQTISAESDSHDYMFNGCTSLNFIHNLLKTVTNTSVGHSGGYNSPIDGWLNNVAEVGIYVKPDSGVTWTDIGIPAGWLVLTESEWADYQLNHPNLEGLHAFIVTVTNESGLVADKTSTEVAAAWRAGLPVYLLITDVYGGDNSLISIIPLTYIEEAYGYYTAYYQTPSLDYPSLDPEPERIIYTHSGTIVNLESLELVTKDKSGAIPIINHGTSSTTFALTPNIHHKWGSVSSLTLTLATPDDSSRVNEYMFSFTSPATPTTLSLPATVNWAIDLDIEANKTYYVSIVDNLATYLTADMVISGADSGALYATKAYVDEMIGELEQQLTNL